MIRAYPEIYLNSAMGNLGDMFDYALNDCHMEISDFIAIFLSSSVSTMLEQGIPKYLVGRSGPELFMDCYWEVAGKELTIASCVTYSRSAAYWCGWALCYYQWFTNRKYQEIFQIISLDELLLMYKTLHEADLSKFVDIMEDRFKRLKPQTNLRIARERLGYSQSQLSEMADVSLRSIQMYEQRQKDINKAQAVTLLKLSKCLYCRIEDLLEA